MNFLLNFINFYRALDGFISFHYATNNNDIEIMQILIKNDVNIEAESSFERRPIHIAAIKGHVESMALLIEKKVDVNV